MIHTVAQGCWVETGFPRWGSPVPQGTELDGESVNPNKMKLHPGYHNLCNVNKAENPTHVKRTTASFTAQHAVNTHEKSWVMLVK